MEPPPELTQPWVHSHEEDVGDEIVFRPKTFPFPPSRGRHGFELLPGGMLIAEGPGETDIPRSQPGWWEMKSPNRLMLHESNQSDRELEIVSVSADKLVVRIPVGGTTETVGG